MNIEWLWLVLTILLLGKLASRAITPKQREWVWWRDENQCMFHERRKVNGKWKWIRCKHKQFPVVGKRTLEVHHILPVRWCKKHLPGWNYDIPTNLILLCKRHHREVHPDLHWAFKEYFHNKDSFNMMLEGRDRMTIRGEIYWVADYDWMLKRLALKNTMKKSRQAKFPRNKKKRRERR